MISYSRYIDTPGSLCGESGLLPGTLLQLFQVRSIGPLLFRPDFIFNTISQNVLNGSHPAWFTRDHFRNISNRNSWILLVLVAIPSDTYS